MKTYLSRLAIRFVVLTVSAPAYAQPTDGPHTFANIEGSRIQEFVVSVSDLEATRLAFTDVFKWSVKQEGPIDPTVIRMWGLPFGTEGREVLVGNDQSQYGYVRLVEIDAPDQHLMRPGARWWDSGGMLNLNILVKDLDATEAGLRELGWMARSLKSTYQRGKSVRGQSQIMIGPDDLMVSFQERQSPPLKGWPPFEGAGHIEVGYQVVTNLEEWYAFYTDILGFEGIGLRDRPQDGPVGPNDYGIPHNTSDGLNFRQANVMFPRVTKQSLGARQWDTAEGYDFSDRVDVPNLGIMAVRMPVPDLDVVLNRMSDAGIELAKDVHILFLEPYGAVRAAMVRSPGGSGQLITLFEPGAAPMTETELKAFFDPGRYGEWVRFNRLLTGTIHYKAGGSAQVTWVDGLDEAGTWEIKGDGICTSWFNLRNFRELCVQHYMIGENRTQSFRIGAGPDGVTQFGSPDTP